MPVTGAIQPHGRLLVLAGEPARLAAFSENWDGVEHAEAALGALTDLETGPAHWPQGEAPAAINGVVLDGRAWDVSVHRSGAHLVIEFEPGAPDAGTRAPLYALARQVVSALQRARTIDDLCELAVRELKRLTGFGHCLAYRFDAEGHGEVLAEALDAGYERHAGHRFPASDLPGPACAPFGLDDLCLIPDTAYLPVALRTTEAASQPARPDLALASLRSVAPKYLETVRDMGMRASMSISIVARGRSWGRVVGYDQAPRHVSFPVRAACEHLGRLLSLQVQATEEHAEVAQRLALRQATLQIVSQCADLDASLLGLVGEPAALLRMARACGAAVVLDDDCRTVGETPPVAAILELARHIAPLGGDSFATDRLGERWPQMQPWADVAAGVLALSISQVHRHLILWFRPAVVQTVAWAGRPRVQARADDRGPARHGFAVWHEQLTGRARPWSAAEMAAALELRHSLVGIVLRRAEELAEVARELGRANKELEAFSYTVSHDLRAPMRHISGYVDLVLDLDGASLSERGRRYLAHAKDASAFAGRLVDGLLDFSRMGRAALQRSRVDTGLLVADLVREFSRLAGRPAIEWTVAHELPVLYADPLLIQLALRNLVANAVKYSHGRDPARVRIDAVRAPDGDGLEVSDNGVGFDMKYVGKLFGVFQRLHHSEEFEGTGIGLATVRRIVERHGGRVWAHGVAGEGARFGFALARVQENV